MASDSVDRSVSSRVKSDRFRARNAWETAAYSIQGAVHDALVGDPARRREVVPVVRDGVDGERHRTLDLAGVRRRPAKLGA